MDDLGPGLYEALITAGLRTRLEALGERAPVEQRALRSAEAADRIAGHLARQVDAALRDIPDDDRVAVGLQVAQALLAKLGELAPTDPAEAPVDPAQALHAILRRNPDGRRGT